MNLQTRKLFVISLIAAVTVLASALTISSWLAEVGAVGWARHVRSEYLTGATVAVIIALLFLLGSQPEIRSIRAPRGGPCRVCDEPREQQGRYCAACGSRA